MKLLALISITTLFTAEAIKLTTSWKVGPDDDKDLDEGTRLSFGNYVVKYHRNFKDADEYRMRAMIYKKHKDEIDKFNKEEAPSAGFVMEEN